MEILCKNETETYKLAEKVAKKLKGGEIIVLSGDLGAGKTTFTKGLAKALGVKENVTSPTFTLLNEYGSGRLKLYHFDMYRIDDERDAEEIGLNELFNSGAVCVIEWAENIKDLLPQKYYTIKIDKIDDTTRKFTFDFNL